MQSPDGKVKRETYFLFSLCVMQFVFSTSIQNQVMFEISLLHLYDCLHVSLQIAEPFLSRLKDETYKLLKQCEEGFQYTRDDRDYSVYTGSGGRVILRHSQLLTIALADQRIQKEGIEILASYMDTINFIH